MIYSGVYHDDNYGDDYCDDDHDEGDSDDDDEDVSPCRWREVGGEVGHWPWSSFAQET